MKLLINGRFLSQRLTGVQRHAVEVVKALDEIISALKSTKIEIVLLTAPGVIWTYSELRSIILMDVGKHQGHVWEQVDLPKYCNGLLINLCNTYPLLAKTQLVTLHDASIYAVPDGYTFSFKVFYKALFNVLRWRRDIPVLTDSRFSAEELQRYIHLPANRITVAHCGCDHWAGTTPDAAVFERFALAKNSYVLAVASENPNKNIARLSRAFSKVAASGKRLVLVGGGNTRVFSADTVKDPPWMLRTGQVSDAELAALYQSAACFVFPSLYEGFGLPPLEAMRFGCPVISSREASLPEVCGDAAHYCDARDENDIARAINEVLNQPLLRSGLVEAGLQQIEKFRWQKTALQILELAKEHSV